MSGKTRSKARSLALAAYAILVALAGGAAGAQSDPPAKARSWDPEPRVELFLSSLFAASAQEGSFGLRGSRRFGRRFALEGSLSRIADDRVDLWLADVSAKTYLRRRGRTGVYLLGGAGVFLSDELNAAEPMLHLGFGAEFDLGRRLYFRPELRGRWFADNVDAVNIADLSVGFGWKL